MGGADLKGIGRRISAQRRQLGYTQEQLAGMMDVSVQMISNLERGVKAIRIDNLIKLCQVLNVSADYILMGTQAYQQSRSLADQIAGLSAKNRKTIEVLVEHFSHSA